MPILPGPPPVEIVLKRSARSRRFSLRVSRLDGRVTLSLSLDAGGRLAMAIADDGRGMSDSDQHKEHAWGLLGMRERIQALGGELRVTSAPAQGTRIDVVIRAA